MTRERSSVRNRASITPTPRLSTKCSARRDSTVMPSSPPLSPLWERSMRDPILQVALNRDHASTQNIIKVHQMDRRLKNLEQKVALLEEEDEKTKTQVAEENSQRLTLVEMCKKALEKSESEREREKAKYLCKRTPLPHLPSN